MSPVAPAPIIVTALFDAADAAWLNDLRRAHFPPERNHLDAHLTLFHHIAPDLARELKQRLSAATRGMPAPQAWLGGVMSLGRGTAFRVESPALESIRAELAHAFAPMLVPQDRAGWRPHVTIQNKVEPAAAKALQAALSASFSRRPLAISGLASWWYRGGPWEPLSRHMFA
ncbi:2'-5' RNA ligase family protein [Sphingomonas baiyangensis]|uniref:2'-5' RNA ligase family protein n=1 Tax=Sphingomonas baiyangensis TaxID=2572576 RepID=A0A4U1L369_9SPHN|nr:2'-5' RNA ligase family protein [Sphingomonas baiyangensis]TKD50515.1 2'-5' RNA ligase family protein [Sphingomonas baiyangensis]